MELKEIVLKLVGDINPHGDSSRDEKTFENLKVLCNLVEELLTTIDYVHYNNKNAFEFSVKRASEHAKKFLTETGYYKENFAQKQ